MGGLGGVGADAPQGLGEVCLVRGHGGGGGEVWRLSQRLSGTGTVAEHLLNLTLIVGTIFGTNSTTFDTNTTIFGMY